MSVKRNKSVQFFGIGKMLPYLKRYRGMILAAVLCALVTGGVDVVVPVYQRYVLNHFVSGSTLDTLPVFLIVYLLTLAAAAVTTYISCWYVMDIEVGLNRDLRNAAFSHLQTLSFSFYNQNSVGYIHARMMSDTSKIGSLFSWRLIEGCWQLTYLVGGVVVMFVINPRLAAMVVVIIPLIAAIFAFFQKKLLRVNRQIREVNSRITGSFNEGITGVRTIKTLGIEQKMSEHFQEETQEMVHKSVQGARFRGLFATTMNLATSCALAIVLWQGGFIAQNEVGTFSMFLSYAQGMLEPVRWVVDCISDLVTTQVNIERFFRLLETPSDVRDAPEVIECYGDSFNPRQENWEPLRGEIEFRDVSFRYPDGEEYVLEHFSLKIPQGSNLAIVGETGSGKSTMVNLICRFFEHTEGQILIDGRDARERSQLWLHRSIGYVLQTPHLFSGTIRDNLLYGNPEATEEEIRSALDLVSARDLVDRLEHGLDSDVGEGGDFLSTGEKQLLSFARAILTDPKILILDEATASVDTITEQRIQQAIDTIVRGRTSILIAHRLSTVRNADWILVIQDGKIAEQGRHADLLRRRGHYYELYTRQYAEEIAESAFQSAVAPAGSPG